LSCEKASDDYGGKDLGCMSFTVMQKGFDLRLTFKDKNLKCLLTKTHIPN
jgi:hypothetical protein